MHASRPTRAVVVVNHARRLRDFSRYDLNMRLARMNGVWLTIKDLVFLDPDEFKGLDLSSLSETFDLTQNLDGAMRNTPYDLSGAPLISWILGRMACLSAAVVRACRVTRTFGYGE